MANYKIQIKSSAKKELVKLPKKDLQRVVNKIRSLASNPRLSGCEKLSGEEKYRVRHGNYRIVYCIEDLQLIVIVVKIGQRKDVYKKR
ncbi:MAG: type II toxin-antitoxin system mRNA interferase toxin, RelE/StbE family [Bacteroidetes bacterium]|nr:MAG: type II toxin-antitoxin system mRNA interferase toxin, RelE/StbE family [Bacteroidota bacterium]